MEISERHRRRAGRKLFPVLPLLLSLHTAGRLEAQPPRIPFQRLSIAEGLLQGTVNTIRQDATGFLWIGTQGGLHRFDGHRFQVFEHDPGNPASLPASWIEALAESDSGDLWIGTQGGLARWRRDTGEFERLRVDPPAANGDPADSGESVRTLLFDRAGDLWIGTFRSGLVRLDPEAGSSEGFRHDPDDPVSLPDDRVRTLYQDRAGDLWIGTLGGLARFDPERRSFTTLRHRPADPTSLSDDRVFAILEDSGGALWVGTEAGLNRRGRGEGGFLRYLRDPEDPASLVAGWVTALLEDRQKRLWIATDGGLHRFRPETGTFDRYRHRPSDPRSLSSDRVLELFEDRTGLLWIGTQGGGLNKWNPSTWSFAHYRSGGGDGGLSSDAVFAFAEDGAGKLYVGTLGGLDVLERVPEGPSAGRFTHFRHDPADPTSLPGDRVTALHHDRAGMLWVGTLGHGLGRLDRATGRFRNFRHDPERPDSLSDDDVSAITEDRDGSLWVATYRGGLNRLDPASFEAGSFAHLRHDPTRPETLSDDHLTALAVDAEGFLWVGTFGGGLNRLDRQRARCLAYRQDPGHPTSLSSDAVYALHQDAAGVLWIGTQVGLNRLSSAEDGRFEHYFERDGLPDDVVWGIQPDGAGRLWLSTNGGLAAFDPETETFRSYTVDHGLQSNEFNFGAHFRSASGELFFGGVNGFNAFFPDRVRGNAAVPPVVLTRITKFNEPLALGRPVFDLDVVSLTHRDHFLTFEFAALDFTAPDKNQYRYRLAGLDDGWISLGNERRVTFASLEPGRHTLEVQGSNSDGVWNEEATILRIHVSPAPWRTWWAYALYAAGLVAVAAIFVRSQHRKLELRRTYVEARERHLQERERLIRELENKSAELERFNYTVSHDLRTPLVTIKNFLGMVRHNFATGQVEHLEADLQRISAAADRMAHLLNDLLEFALIGRQLNPPRRIALEDLVREARELLAGLFEEHQVELVIADDLPDVYGDPVRLRAVLQNLLENAVKYMGDQAAPRIEVGVRHRGDERVFFVADNGVGIAPKYHDKVFGLFERLDAGTRGTGVGLALVRRILELHRGRIWVESDGLGTGSTFCFTVGEYVPLS